MISTAARLREWLAMRAQGRARFARSAADPSRACAGPARWCSSRVAPGCRSTSTSRYNRMHESPDLGLADAVLALHVAIILFNVFGLIAIPLGAWCGWRFVRVAWWRLLHLLALAVVAAQAVAGRACFLTLLQDALRAQHGRAPPLIMQWANRLIFWPLPLWFFAGLYVLVWLYVLALWWWVPPDWPHRRMRRSQP